MKIPTSTIDWLREAGTPAIRYTTRLLTEKKTDRAELLADPFVKENIQLLKRWDKEVLERHNTPDLLMHRLALLADLGVKADDPGMAAIVKTILKHANERGIPEIIIRIPRAFGGTDEPERAWLICDFPVVLYGLLAMGVKNAAIDRALAALESLADDNGIRCQGSIPTFHGPGRKEGMCPIACLYTARALSVRKESSKSAAAGKAVAALLGHWEERKKKKHYMFGIGTDFQKLKFPFVWYNILHVLDTVSRFDFCRGDRRVREMTDVLLSKADEGLRFKPESVYMAYKGQDFSDKKNCSPTITLMVLRILKRMERVS
jgi:hypothetical protein